MGDYVCIVCGNGFTVSREGTLFVACPTCGNQYRVTERSSNDTLEENQ